jgi:hypothetical protein
MNYSTIMCQSGHGTYDSRRSNKLENNILFATTNKICITCKQQKKERRELDCLIFSWRELDISLVFSWYSCSSFTLASYPKLHNKKWMMQSSTPVWAPTWNPGKNHNKKRVIHHNVLNLVVGRITQDLQLWTAAAVKGDDSW